MRLFGFDITFAKAAHIPAATPSTPINSGPGWLTSGNLWWPLVREPFTGAWQRNMELRGENLLSYYALYACVTLIASDISKCRIRLVQKDSNGIWMEVESASPFWPVLRKPNHYQNRIQFMDSWVKSKLLAGNTYVLKERDDRNVVTRLYVLDPRRCRPAVADDGSIWYDLNHDALSGINVNDPIRVPQSEIIHDRSPLHYHPLCGISPIMACGLSALQGLAIQNQSASFFSNNSSPGGILSAPGYIQDTTAKRLKDHWEANYTGNNVGKIAVLGDGLKYEKLSVDAVDAQLIEQLKFSAETVCSAFHVPSYMVGVGPPPNYNNIEGLNQQYYSQCLQSYFENIELCLDEGLGLTETPGKVYGTEFDLTDLIRMDSKTRTAVVADSIKAGFMAPNEGRKIFDMPPVEGGDSPMMQQQNFSLEALAERDADQPFAKPPEPAPGGGEEPPPSEDGDGEQEQDDAETARALADDLITRAQRYAFVDYS